MVNKKQAYLICDSLNALSSLSGNRPIANTIFQAQKMIAELLDQIEYLENTNMKLEQTIIFTNKAIQKK